MKIKHKFINHARILFETLGWLFTTCQIRFNLIEPRTGDSHSLIPSPHPLAWLHSSVLHVYPQQLLNPGSLSFPLFLI